MGGVAWSESGWVLSLDPPLNFAISTLENLNAATGQLVVKDRLRLTNILNRPENEIHS